MPTVRYSYDMTQAPPGKLFDENAQCKLTFGPGSRFCEVGIHAWWVHLGTKSKVTRWHFLPLSSTSPLI